MKASHLACKGCGATYPLEALFACDRCFGPLEVGWDESEPVARERVEAGPADAVAVRRLPARGAARGGAAGGVLAADQGRPAGGRARPRVRSLHQDRDVEPDALVQGPGRGGGGGEGRRARLRGARLRVDRATWPAPPPPPAAALGLPTYIFVPADLEREKIIAAAAYGATVFAVDGSYDDVNRLCSELTYERPWAFVNVNMRAYYAEGSKTIALETAEQLGWRAPDRVVAPIASGSLYTKILQGFEQGRAAGLIAPGPAPVMHGAQGEGCAPGGLGVRRGGRRRSCRCARPGSPSRSPSATRPTACTRSGVARRTGGSDRVGRRRRRSSTASACSPAPPASSPRPPAASPRPCCAAWPSGARSAPGETVVAYITGDGLKTIDAVAPAVATIDDPRRHRRGRCRAGRRRRRDEPRCDRRGPEDFAAVVALGNAYGRALTGTGDWSEEPTSATTGRGLADAERDAWLVERDGAVVGLCRLHDDGEGSLRRCGWVDPDRSGHGDRTLLVERDRAARRRELESCAAARRAAERRPARGSRRPRAARGARLPPASGILRMLADLAGAPPAPDWPDGVVAAAFDPRRTGRRWTPASTRRSRTSGATGRSRSRRGGGGSSRIPASTRGSGSSRAREARCAAPRCARRTVRHGLRERARGATRVAPAGAGAGAPAGGVPRFWERGERRVGLGVDGENRPKPGACTSGPGCGSRVAADVYEKVLRGE